MKHSFVYAALLAVAMFAASCCSDKTAPAIPVDRQMEKKIDKILKGLTLEEKVGQMTQITITAMCEGTELTPVADSLIRVHKIGSVLNTINSEAQTPEVWEKVVKELNRMSMEYIGIPCHPRRELCGWWCPLPSGRQYRSYIQP